MLRIDYSKLCEAIQKSRQILRWPRQQRFELAREIAGDHFSEGGARRKVKFNLLSLHHTIFTNILVANEPRYIATTFDADIRAAVRTEQDWLNDQCVRMELGETGRACVGDALMATGICQVALATPCDAARLAWGITAGEPIAQPIDLDDWVYGTNAYDFCQTDFMGHRFRCPLDVGKKMYGSKARNLVEEDPAYYNREGDERINRLSNGTYQPEEFEPHVELWQIYLPRHKMIVVLSDQDVVEPDKNGQPQPLWTQPWVGPSWGPYLFLRFQRIPGSALAKAPMMDLLEPHLDANNVHRKVNMMLRDLKELMIYPRGADQDAANMKKASSGDWVPVENPDKIKAVITGGQAIQGMMIAAEQYKSNFDFIGGNLSLIGGRQSQSKTLGQDKILNQNAGGSIQAMHSRVDTFMSKLGESMLWFAHYHPQLVMKSGYSAPGSRGINRRLYPAGDTRGPARDFELHRASLRLDPYSIRHKTPEERLAFIMSVLGQTAPMMPIFQQQGLGLDATKLMDIFSRYGDAPELEELYQAMPPPGDGGKGQSHGRTMPTQTERTYNRNDVSSGQGPGAGQQLAEMSKDAFASNGVPA